MNFISDETITESMIGKIHRMKHDVRLEHFEMKVIVAFLEMFP